VIFRRALFGLLLAGYGLGYLIVAVPILTLFVHAETLSGRLFAVMALCGVALPAGVIVFF
jgi:hypothetical protein